MPRFYGAQQTRSVSAHRQTVRVSVSPPALRRICKRGESKGTTRIGKFDPQKPRDSNPQVPEVSKEIISRISPCVGTLPFSHPPIIVKFPSRPRTSYAQVNEQSGRSRTTLPASQYCLLLEFSGTDWLVLMRKTNSVGSGSIYGPEDVMTLGLRDWLQHLPRSHS